MLRICLRRRGATLSKKVPQKIEEPYPVPSLVAAEILLRLRHPKANSTGS